MTNHIQNQFLTTPVYQACTQARISYLDTLARRQANGGLSPDMLRGFKANHVGNLEMFREAAMNAAFAGNIAIASSQLAYIVMEWAFYKAYDDLIDANGAYLDPADSDTRNDIVQAVQSKAVYWANELQNRWDEGDTQRKTDLIATYAQRQGQLQTMYVQVFGEQQTSLNQAHHYNQLYADTALKGVNQAQQGVQWMQQNAERVNQQAAQNVQWYQQGVQNMYTHGVNVMDAAVRTQQELTKHMEQTLPREMEKAQAKIERRKIVTRGVVTLILMLSVPAALFLAYFLLTHVVLR